MLSEDDPRGELALAALGQEAVEKASAVFVITAVHARSVVEYRARGDRFVTLEAGHVAQNLLLQAVALGLAAVPIGAFEVDEVWAGLELPRKHRPLYLVAVGNPRGGASRAAAGEDRGVHGLTCVDSPMLVAAG